MAVERSDAVVEDGLVVLFGGVAFVVVPAIVRIEFVLFIHVIVAVGFGKDRGGSNSLVFGVAFDDAAEGNIGLVDEAVAVDEKVLRLDRKLRYGNIHGMERGAKDVHAVDIGVIDGCHCPSRCVVLNLGAEKVSLFCGELFRVV